MQKHYWFSGFWSKLFYKYSESLYGHNSKFYGDVYSELLEKNINPVAFSLKDETIEKALPFLKRQGLNEDDQFVTLHLREPGQVIEDEHHQYRNVNPHDYLKAIDWLLESGLKIVRIGHPKMTPIPKRKGLIDLTRIPYPDEVDLYVCARAKFYYGSVSGPFSISDFFGSNLLLTNVNQYNLNRPRALVQLRPFKNSTGDIVSMRDIRAMELSSITAVEPYKKNGLKPENLTNDDHLKSVKDMISFLEGGSLVSANTKRKKETGQAYILSSYTTDSLGLL